MARFSIQIDTATGARSEVPFTAEEEAAADAAQAALLEPPPPPTIQEQIDALYKAISLEDWALAQPDDAGGTAAGRTAMAAKMAQIAALRAQL